MAEHSDQDGRSKTDTALNDIGVVAKDEPVLALLQDTFDVMDDGVALFDNDLRFVLCNNRYRELAFHPGYPIPKRGDSAEKIGLETFKTGFYELPDGVKPEGFAQQVVEFVRSYIPALELRRSDGRILRGAAKKTALGGYLITMTDVSDTKRLEIVTENRLEILSDAVSGLEEGFALIDPDLHFLLCNERYMQLAFPPDHPEIVPGTSLRDALRQLYDADHLVLDGDPSFDEFAEDIVTWVARCGPPREYQFKDGRVTSAKVVNTALGGFLILISDITEQRNSDQKARDMLYESFQSLDEGMVLCDNQMRFVFANEAWKKMIFDDIDVEPPRPGDDVIENLRDVVKAGYYDIPDGMSDDDYIDWMMGSMAEHGKQVPYQSSDGRHFSGSSHLTSFGGSLLFIRDTTKQHNVEEQARETLLDAVQALNEGLALYDRDMRFVYANASWYEMFYGSDREHPKIGTTAREIAQRDLEDGTFVVPDGLNGEEAIEGYMELTRAHAKGVPIELTNGRRLLASSHETKLDGYLVSFTDVTDVHASEERARASLLDAIEALDQSIALIDSDGAFVFANEAWHQMWMPGGPRPFAGERPEKIIERQLELYPDMFDKPPDMSAMDFAASLSELYVPQPQKYEMPTANGRIILGSSHKTQRDGFLLTFDDVTDERKARDRLLESVTAALQSLTDGVALFDADLNFIVGNDRYLEMWYPDGVDDPKPGEHMGELALRAMASGHMKVPDGMNKEEVVEDLLRQSRNFAKNLFLETQDRHFVANAHQTSLGGYLLEFTDITERLQAEEELARSREVAHQNEKLSALGELLAGVAHELNNPLSVVFGYSQMLQGKINDPVLDERIDLICQSAERAAKIVKTFLAMARQRPAKVELCSINEIAATALEVCSYSLKTSGTRVTTDLDDSVPLVSGDFDQLAQVFSNLIINAGQAVEFLREAGEIHVRSFFDKRRQETVLEIRDNGAGIPEEIQNRIFEPFFTTKKVGEGTGVGLAFSHRIVQSHDGVLDLLSSSGKGTSFFVRLGAASDKNAPDAAPSRAAPHSSIRSILVVDDEEGVARLLKDVLSEEGFIVTTTTSPREALKLASAKDFDVILSDFKMPDMDGQTFYNALTQLVPKLADRIAFVTGDAMSPNVAAFFAETGRPHIEKPIVKSELLALLRQASGLQET
ncbi:MAG: PAS-domain containing protein [Pseudomonadota bacterium]